MTLFIENLTKKYSAVAAVDNLTLELPNGVHGLLGPNGAGKSTLMRMICGVLKPTYGTIKWDGRDTLAMGASYRALLGYLPQEFGYYPEFTPIDFLRYMEALKGINKRDVDKQAYELLKAVGLPKDKATAKIRTFSGGMKQRLGIAQAILGNPKILILDEPTAGLDPKERVRFKNLLTNISQNRVVLLCTHIVSDVDSIADNVLVMKAGRIVAQGSPKDVAGIVNGKVWETLLNPEQVPEVEKDYTVTAIHYTQDGQVLIRTVGDHGPAQTSRKVSPNLEDYYLDTFQDDLNEEEEEEA